MTLWLEGSVRKSWSNPDCQLITWLPEASSAITSSRGCQGCEQKYIYMGACIAVACDKKER